MFDEFDFRMRKLIRKMNDKLKLVFNAVHIDYENTVAGVVVFNMHDQKHLYYDGRLEMMNRCIKRT